MRRLIWVGSSLDDMRSFPRTVQGKMGYALFRAQDGDKHPDAKPLRGFGGGGVLEVVADLSGDTYRTVYTLSLPDAVYVLHAFQKKSTHGITTPKREMDLVRRRLRDAQEIAAERRKLERIQMIGKPGYVESSGNVFADLGMADPDELLAKAQLAHAIAKVIEHHGWTQSEAARVLGIAQPNVSLVLRGHLDGFSTERLFRFLNSLGQNVHIVVSPKPAQQDHASVTVSMAASPGS